MLAFTVVNTDMTFIRNNMKRIKKYTNNVTSDPPILLFLYL